MAARIPIVRTVARLRRATKVFRQSGETIALVPTMGALHAGHVALVRAAKRRAARVVVSIFVNPAQFGPTEDFSSYPRTFEADIRKLDELGVDLVWAPRSVAEMYPAGFATRIVPSGPASVGLEDAFRPHFFEGVATVVAKLLLQVRPDFAVFGEKDFQQLRVVQRIAVDLDLAIRILGVPTVREPDGLALSSRNVYLSAEQRAIAPVLFQTLRDCAERIRQRVTVPAVMADGRRAVERAGFAVDYLEARHAQSLRPATAGDPLRLLVAAKLGSTRLIDNIGIPARS